MQDLFFQDYVEFSLTGGDKTCEVHLSGYFSMPVEAGDPNSEGDDEDEDDEDDDMQLARQDPRLAAMGGIHGM